MKLTNTFYSIYHRRLNSSIIMNTYQRFTESTSDEPQYVVDGLGNLHDLSGNIGDKLESVDRNIEYWRARLTNNPKSERANKYLHNFVTLRHQIMLFIEGTKFVSLSD